MPSKSIILMKCPKMLICLIIPLCLSFVASAQKLKQETLRVDDVSFPGFKAGDTTFSTYFSRGHYINHRQIENKIGSIFFEPTQYRIFMGDSGYASSRTIYNSDSLLMQLYDSKDSIVTGINLLPAGTKFIGDYHTFTGKGIILPKALPENHGSSETSKEGIVYFNSETGGLFSNRDGVGSPAYLEWYDRNATPNVNSIYYGYPDDWITRLNEDKKVPVLRMRHPLNVTGVNYTTDSEKRDFIIAPYEYGILMRYSGVFEADVSQFSIHVGTSAGPLDIENNGFKGHGGVLWVGDDVDLGGLRATSRNKDTVLYSEISSETFIGATHGHLRQRVVDQNDQFQFVQGVRGSTNKVVYIYQDSIVSGIGSGGEKPLVLGTENNPGILRINNNGNTGLGNIVPTSKIDIEGENGYDQFRLRKKYTPINSNDPNGQEGDQAWDDDYLYIKTKFGWKRTKLESF